MDNYIGMKLDGRYELLEIIGSGGMAEIYKADDTVEDRTVAVKILKNEFAGSEEFLRRFRNESKAIALLSHPNIVKISDVGFTESVQFIVMEYIDGITLIDYIEKQGVLKWREALGFAQQILKALQHAHDRGIVHRDIKSQNVMLLPNRTIKVMDFGIARFNREIDKTMSEKAIGSVHYISPEQARGDITDEKSDLYSVGVMLYEMLTGIKPFDGNDALAIALMHTNKKPKRPSEVNSSIPEGLEEITLRAMQKEPAKRYQTAGEMLNDLKEFEKNPSVVFEYKYSSPDGDTKYFDKVGKPVANVATVTPIEVNYNEDDDGYDEDEVIERRSPLLPILFAVASAFVIITAVLITLVVKWGISGEDSIVGGRSRQKMPNVVGMTYSEASRAYPWLQMDPKPEHSGDFPKDTIMDQEIAEGRMINPNQTVVIVTVSRGKEVIYMPDFTRNAILGEDVVAQLTRLGLRARTIQVYDKEVPLGFFVKADRDPNDELSKGDEVRVWISKGDEDSYFKTKVPDMLNLSENQAKENATNHRISIEVIPSESTEEQIGKVIGQSIDPHTEVNNWTVVEVYIGTGPGIPPEDVVRASSIGFDTGTWTGVYEITYFIDGVLQVDKTEKVDIGVKNLVVWDFENAGIRTYSIRIKSDATGKEGLLASYQINFMEDPPIKTPIEENFNIFDTINTATSTTTNNSSNSPTNDQNNR